MKKRFLQSLCVMLALLPVTFLAACGEGAPPSPDPSDGSDRPEGKKIVIYTGGSSEFSWVKGSDEDRIIDYIEDKYYEETGNSLDFEVAYLGESMRQKLTSELAGGTQVDIAVSHTRGGVGIDDFVRTNDLYYNLADLIETYAPNLYNSIKGTPLNSMTTYSEEVVAIPSVINPYKFGILVRKDYMEQAGFTDDPEMTAETCPETGENYVLVDDLEAFEDMCLAMNEITGNSYAVSGAMWDAEKVLVLGPYTDSGYFTTTIRDYTGQDGVYPGYTTEEYGDVLQKEYEWAVSGVMSQEANATLLEQAESAFISGSTGVFVQDPTIQHLIQVARRTKTANPEAEFTVLGPLTKDAESTKKGFMRNAEATFGAAILKTSERTVDILKFLNWVYKDADTYNLCRLGIEGEHWIDNGDGTYSYPEGKENYLTSPPYSGILTLVENQNVSNLVYDGYTEEELSWIELAATPEFYIENDLIDYILPRNEQYAQQAQNNMYEAVVVKAWTGQADPSLTFYDAILRYRENAKNHVEYQAAAYKSMKARFELLG